MFVPNTSEIWTKLYGPNYTKFWAFETKTVFKKQNKTKQDKKQQQQQKTKQNKTKPILD